MTAVDSCCLEISSRFREHQKFGCLRKHVTFLVLAETGTNTIIFKMNEPQASVKWNRQPIAVALILLVDILWVSSSELTQTIFHNASYEHPYFLSYFNTSLFSLYALCFIPLFYHTLKQKYQSNHVLQKELPANYESINNLNPNEPNSKSFSKIISSHSCCITSIPSDKLSILETFKLSIIFCIIWFSMTYTFNLSLNLTSVASNSIISSMSGPFCLILSRCFLQNYQCSETFFLYVN